MAGLTAISTLLLVTIRHQYGELKPSIIPCVQSAIDTVFNIAFAKGKENIQKISESMN